MRVKKELKQGIVTAFTDITVPFYDVDSMRIVWHGHYVKYLEDARCALLDKIDYNYLEMEASGYIWPIVDMRIKYVASAEFAANIRIYAVLVEYESRIKIEYEIHDLATQKILTKAHTVQVAVDMQSHELQYESPKIILKKLQPFLTINNEDSND